VKFLLDTDHITFLTRRAGPEYAALSARMAQHAPADFAFSVVSFLEQILGWNAFLSRARTSAVAAQAYERILGLLRDYSATPVLAFDLRAAAEYDNLVAQRVRVGTLDLRIAAIALANGLTVLTRNVRDFGRVPNLVSEDWTA
jgi:tRNA(fMet)-specific endonuclease VapC